MTNVLNLYRDVLFVTFGMGRRLSVSISPVTMAKGSFYIVGVGYRLAVHQMRLNFSYGAYESNN